MDPEALLRCADLALYRAKGQGRGDFVFFESEMTASAHYRRVLELELREALMLRLRIPTKAPCCNDMMPPPVTE
jgi:predicted signal transduction protein with EAL and GGDEF domain